MRNPFKRKPKPYVAERDRLLLELPKHLPDSDAYKAIMARIDQLDKILNRTTELKKTVIPTLVTVGSLTGIWVAQQFGGFIIPKAIEQITAKQAEQKKLKELE